MMIKEGTRMYTAHCECVGPPSGGCTVVYITYRMFKSVGNPYKWSLLLFRVRMLKIWTPHTNTSPS